MAPLSTFSSLYNLFLLPILDDEFLNGEAIFSKGELIKMGCHLKDVCLGIIQLMHPDTAKSQAASAGDSVREADIYKNLSRRQMAAPSRDPAFLALRKQAMCFTHLFQQCVQLVQRLYTVGFKPLQSADSLQLSLPFSCSATFELASARWTCGWQVTSSWLASTASRTYCRATDRLS